MKAAFFLAILFSAAVAAIPAGDDGKRVRLCVPPSNTTATYTPPFRPTGVSFASATGVSAAAAALDNSISSDDASSGEDATKPHEAGDKTQEKPKTWIIGVVFAAALVVILVLLYAKNNGGCSSCGCVV